MLAPADIAKLAAAVAATIVVTLLWIHCSAQQRVDRSELHSVKVALRLLVIHAVVIGVLCVVGRMPVNYYLGMTAVVYLFAAMASWESTPWAPTDEVLGFIIGILMFVPSYVLKQFVLGFPDRDEVILKPPKCEKSNDPPPRKSDTGTVVATLRPMGKVELAGEQFNAVSAYGTMIDVGTPIRVTGQRGDAILVAEHSSETSEPHAHGPSS